MTPPIWPALLSSTILAAAIGALAAGIFALQQKNKEYVNDYFKIVLNRRLNAYDKVENLISHLKAAVLDVDGMPYHILFSKPDDWEYVHQLLFEVLGNGLWLSPKIYAKTRELNILIFKDGDIKEDLRNFGKRNYEDIANLREDLERLHAVDMLEMHKIPAFLRVKKKCRHGFELIAFRNRIIEEAGPLHAPQSKPIGMTD
jgi:hypothetical protein